MYFPIKSNKYDFNFARLLRRIKEAIDITYEQEKTENGIDHAYIASELGVDRSTVSKRLKCDGNITLKTLSDLYVAMGREPLDNFHSYDETYNPENSAQYLISSAPEDRALLEIKILIHKDSGIYQNHIIDESRNTPIEQKMITQENSLSMIEDFVSKGDDLRGLELSR